MSKTSQVFSDAEARTSDPATEKSAQDGAADTLSIPVPAQKLLADPLDNRGRIMAAVVEGLFSLHEQNGELEQVFAFLGKTVCADRILFLEKSFDHTLLQTTASWAVDGELYCPIVNFPISQNAFIFPGEQLTEHLFFCDTLSPLKKNSLFAQESPASFVACTLIQDGFEVGFLVFERKADNAWTRDEAFTLALVGKLMGAFIRQLQSVDILRKTQQNTRSLLNWVPFYVYVIEKGSHRLLYFNETVSRSFPGVKLGLTCHQAFWNNPKKCDFCPAETMGTASSVTAMLPQSPFWENSDVSFTNILWDNHIPAHIALIAEHVASPTEKEERKRREAFALAMSAVYDYVFDIDLESGSYDLLAVNGRVPHGDELHGTYDEDIKYVDMFVHKDFLDAFLDVFSLEKMREGRPSELEYLSLHGSEYRWKHRQSFPYTQNDGTNHVLSVVRDIHGVKVAALHKEQEEANVQVALRNSYSRIYLLDLQTGSFNRLFNNINVIKSFSLSENFETDMQCVGESIVHPDDREAFFGFYNIKSIREGLKTERELEFAYRCQRPDEEYAWFSSLVVALPDNADKVMLLIRDITERRRLEEAQRALELRYMTVFRQSCDTCIEVDMRDWSFRRTSFRKKQFDCFPGSGHFREFLSLLYATAVHPEDLETVRELFSPEHFLKVLEGQHREFVAQYRLRHGTQGYRWKEARIVFLEEGDHFVAFILIHDITHQKTLELQKSEDEQRFNIAIRNSYCEILELDFDESVAVQVYTTGLLAVIPRRELKDVAEALVHPEDQEHFIEIYNCEQLRKRLMQGGSKLSEEYRRLGTDGKYRWVSATVLPMSSENGTLKKGLHLIRDITDQKKQEQRQRIAEQYDRALRNLYDELYEMNITQDSYKIVYHVKEKYVIPPDSGKLSTVIPYVAQNMIHPEDQERFVAFVNPEEIHRHFAEGGDYLIGEFRKLWTDGAFHWASLTMFPVDSPSGEDEIYLVFIMDIGAKKQAEEIAQHNAALERQRLDDERYRTIIEQTDTLVFEWWNDTDQRYLSPEIPLRFQGNYNDRDLFRIWREDMVIHSDDMPHLDALIHTLRADGDHAEMTVRFRKRLGGSIWCRVAVSCMRDEHGRAKRYIGTLNDVDTATQSMRELRFRAEYDVLTGLYNMSAFYSHAANRLHHNPGREYYIVRMDIERFKVINDLYGLIEGDKLLQFISDVLSQKMTARDLCGRISGDIFCMLVEGSSEHTVQLIGEIMEHVALYPLPYKIKPSFGICQVESEDTPINVLCDWANLALRTIKGSYIRSYAFYDGTLREGILNEKIIENRMHDALNNGEFVVYLQPKVDISTSHIVGAEGLVRWIHPEKGLVPPDCFVPLFEKNGFILQLDECVWEQTCILLRSWLDKGLNPPPVSVNVSRTHIHDPLLFEKLVQLVQRHNVPASLLQLEMTESAFLENESELFCTMEKLRGAGFRFSMDDFGSGYSSLNMLKSIPVDYLKIDRAFLNEVVATDRGKTVIRYSIAMAREMNIGVIAEGVETVEQAAFLLRAGCSFAQGYLYSRPLPPAEFEALAFGERQPPFPVHPSICALTEDAGALT